MTAARRADKPASRAKSQSPRVQALLAQLVHDVGKYLARTARNLPATESVDSTLLAMLCRDLYGDAAAPRPAARFAALLSELQPLLADASLAEIAAKFIALADLEADVRAGAPAAITRAAALALQVDAQLRTLATQYQRRPKPRAR